MNKNVCMSCGEITNAKEKCPSCGLFALDCLSCLNDTHRDNHPHKIRHAERIAMSTYSNGSA